MEKFLVPECAGHSVSRRRLPAGTGQRTLQDCKKTVTLRGHTAMNFKIEHIYACKSILEQDSSTPEDKMEQLRILSVMHVSKEHLQDSKVGHVVRKLGKDSSPEVARIASKLVEKWRAEVMQQRRASNNAKSQCASSTTAHAPSTASR
ncbi:Transcription elongation factor A N-terminal and central domain-containing protein 2 [Trebouxia sp. C0010 RCD-2024]